MTHPGINLNCPRVVMLESAAVCDWRRAYSPGALLIEVIGPRTLRVLAAGRPAEVAGHPAAAVATVERHPDGVLIPGLVNAHAHLDLTHIGPREIDPRQGFGGFVDLVRRERRAEAAEIGASVRLGVEKCLAGGVVAVGDIAGAVRGRASTLAMEGLMGEAIAGVSFVEFFGIGAGEEPGIEAMQGVLAAVGGVRGGWPRVGVSPHAPNTVSYRGYAAAMRAAREHRWPVVTHVAETSEEREFIARGTGPQRRFLESLGLWQDSMLEEIGKGRTPVAHVIGAIGAIWERWGRHTSFVHVNDCSDEDLELMVRAGVGVIYCPHASEYFKSERVFGAHRYREMLAAGVRVALGTDSVINQPRGELSILAEMGLLHRRDGTDAATLLKMATEHGALALGLMPERFEFGGGEVAGVVVAGTDRATRRKYPDWHPLRWVLGTEQPRADLLYIGTDYC